MKCGLPLTGIVLHFIEPLMTLFPSEVVSSQQPLRQEWDQFIIFK